MLPITFYQSRLTPMVQFGQQKGKTTPRTLAEFRQLPVQKLVQLPNEAYYRLNLKDVPPEERTVSSSDGGVYLITPDGLSFERQEGSYYYTPRRTISFGPYLIEKVKEQPNLKFLYQQLDEADEGLNPYFFNDKELEVYKERLKGELEQAYRRVGPDAAAIADTHATIVEETGLDKGFDELSLRDRVRLLRSDDIIKYHTKNLRDGFWLLARPKSDPSRISGFLHAMSESNRDDDPPLGHVGDVYINMLFFRAEARGSGAPYHLMHLLMLNYPDKSLSLIVSSNNPHAIEFYEKIGFEKTGRTGIFPAGDVEMPMTEMLLPEDKVYEARKFCHKEAERKRHQKETPKLLAYA